MCRGPRTKTIILSKNKQKLTLTTLLGRSPEGSRPGKAAIKKHYRWACDEREKTIDKEKLTHPLST